MSSLASATVRGSAWIISTSIGARALGVIGTLVITRYLAPDVYGEVQAASVVVMSAGQLSTVGLGQYLIAHPKEGRDTAFHATIFHVGLGVVALAVTMAFAGPLGRLVGAPGMSVFLPGLVLSALLDRFSFMPERVLVRDMSFRQLGGIRTASEIVYTLTAVGLAMVGWGGAAIVAGNVTRSASKMLLMALAADRREWLQPCKLSWEKTRAMFAFGVPLSLGASAGYAARRWDNLIMSALFGPSVLGAYNLAYNLADIPAAQVGEQIADVLLPSFARLPPERRPFALARAVALLSLLMAPLAIGLGAVAPTLVRAFFDERWSQVAPMLAVLSALSVARPIGGVIWSYLQAAHMPRLVMLLEGSKLLLLVVVMITLGRVSPLWACAAVGVAFGAHTVASLWVVDRAEKLPIREIVMTMLAPVLACIPMVVAVEAMRHGLHTLGIHSAFIGLGLEMLAGALVYIPSALLIAPNTSRDLLALSRTAFGRRTQESPASAS